MLPFELSAIDLVLVIAVIVLLILFIAKSSVKPTMEEKMTRRVERSPLRSMVTSVVDQERDGRERASPQLQEASSQCPYGFGYLRGRHRDAPIPDSCLGCSRIIECAGSSD